MFDGEHAPGSSKARLNLICDQQDPMPVAQAAQLPQETTRSDDKPALALDGLHDQSGDPLRSHLGCEETVQLLQGVVHACILVARKAVRVGEARKIDFGCKRAESVSVRVDLSGQ